MTADYLNATERATALVRRYFERVLSDGDVSVTPDLFAAEYVAHDPSLPPLPPGPEGVALHAFASRVAFPDQRCTLEDLFCAGDRVAVRFTLRGTHRGALLDLAPTGRRVEVQGLAIYRIAAGKIAEGWINLDMLGLLAQLGLPRVALDTPADPSASAPGPAGGPMEAIAAE